MFPHPFPVVSISLNAKNLPSVVWGRCDCGEVSQREPPPALERKTQMATKTQNIEVKVDERLAAEITGKAVERWHATTFSNGKRKVYVTFEEVKTMGT